MIQDVTYFDEGTLLRVRAVLDNYMSEEAADECINSFLNAGILFRECAAGSGRPASGATPAETPAEVAHTYRPGPWTCECGEPMSNPIHETHPEDPPHAYSIRSMNHHQWWGTTVCDWPTGDGYRQCSRPKDHPIHQTTTPAETGEVSTDPHLSGRDETPEKLTVADHVGIFDGPPLAVECRYYRGTCDDHPECQPDYYTGDPE